MVTNILNSSIVSENFDCREQKGFLYLCLFIIIYPKCRKKEDCLNG
jgi:hypothetical protein